ncbi:hypothetical protein KOM00_12955 [Geomonas sp. Red69]|uniref:Uncharacterized protein n=1 Tax=Geomonas diazotrophica TaxID=2843197 RepID=A0ABX8JGA7_9BACT|nr:MULTISPECIES: hypothetical protein [Geomonas]MBU5637637.1 hypothetical protein [Geomonas diazotrophica]QWV96176.1 hypothetical protein KP005_12380 [Geomonas nitrogeniifigens]QXE85243.1 hypothetical protein KP003_12660 [Geomonas nitrogeniifigens]
MAHDHQSLTASTPPHRMKPLPAALVFFLLALSLLGCATTSSSPLRGEEKDARHFPAITIYTGSG